MEHIFVEVLNRSIAAGWAILAVAALRLLVRRAPKLSLTLSKETVRSDAADLDGNFVDSGIRFLDDAVNPALRRSFGSAAIRGR